MKEVKTPKKPLAFYYIIVLILLLLFNFLAMPLLAQGRVQQVDYGTFMSMTYDDNIGQVDVQDNQILFTDRENTQIYKTGLMYDPDLTQRLYDHGAVFASEIVEEQSPLLMLLLTWILPIVIFIAIGRYMSKKLTDRAAGPNSMLFGMGGTGGTNAMPNMGGTGGTNELPSRGGTGGINELPYTGRTSAPSGTPYAVRSSGTTELPEQYRPLSPWAYFGLQLLFAIPVIGFIFLIVFSCKKSNINRRNFARSYWCALLSAVIVCTIVFIVAAILGYSFGDKLF